MAAACVCRARGREKERERQRERERERKREEESGIVHVHRASAAPPPPPSHTPQRGGVDIRKEEGRDFEKCRKGGSSYRKGGGGSPNPGYCCRTILEVYWKQRVLASNTFKGAI